MNSLQLGNLSQLGVAILVLIYIVYLQIALRPVKPSRYVILPIILFYITIKAIAGLGGDIYKEIAPMVLLATIGLVSGLASGLITKIFTGEDGVLYQKGGIAAAILLFFTIPIRFILRHSIASLPGGKVLNNTGISYLIMLSSQFISRSLVVFVRSPQVWTLYLQQRRNKKARKNKRRKLRRLDQNKENDI
ncbi:hypothetical protein FDC45_17535 [Clostridium botulinum]|uniref:DUF1453 family protein n=1 Tax=Clostridium botulinum TaxID=1491 RepID=A0A846J7X2_CLOBO|nr:hypothetical protein [Clostridium botulinum]ACA55688.1 hypothetical protein CLK_3040 [Clostridium botulinum A3 str. Loch Maree]NFH65911.1 hypothetical protein [Clostridium botulinum]NFJ10206.1 hypothetical protein [Clostridium botulinum]NFK16432.1 hypothetical protein [Clostridium botulinum]NFM94004.1 hypothetical protein [Clostridium botulinum]